MEPTLILIDSHVHIYNKYDIKNFLYYALKNFENESKNLGFENFIGFLFLTETRDDNYFSKLKENRFENALIELNFIKIINHENDSIVYKTHDNNYLVIISGKQIITSEKLEVLALGTTKTLNYGESLRETVDKIKLFGALPVIPWGVGKWIGKRKKIIENFLDNNRDLKFFLGDNSGRPIFWSTPKLFKIAHRKGILVLRGSDPLPLHYQEKKVGKFGFYMKANLDINTPAKNINEILLNLNDSPGNFGSLENPFDFLKNQFAMQLRKIF